MPTIPCQTLLDFSTAMMAAGGLAAPEAQLVARSLVDANLRGHDSHGVMRIPYYLDMVAKRETLPGQKLRVIRETETLLVTDGQWGFGQTLAQELTARLIEKTKRSGVAVGTLIQSGHIGRLGEYCELAANVGLISIVMVNTHGAARRVAPVGGTAPRLGTNPLAIGAPHDDAPLVLDFGTSATAEGKVRVKKIAGELCPDGWLLDNTGQATNDPNTLYGSPPGTIRPMGGDQAYKGFGLALMIEVLCGALSGGMCARETPINQLGNCVYMQLIDPGKMGGQSHYAKEVADLITFVRSCPTAAGVSGITLPGDPERAMLAKRTREGITLDEGNWRQLKERAEKLGVESPV